MLLSKFRICFPLGCPPIAKMGLQNNKRHSKVLRYTTKAAQYFNFVTFGDGFSKGNKRFVCHHACQCLIC